jgi:hypothetical protein
MTNYYPEFLSNVAIKIRINNKEYLGKIIAPYYFGYDKKEKPLTSLSIFIDDFDNSLIKKDEMIDIIIIYGKDKYWFKDAELKHDEIMESINKNNKAVAISIKVNNAPLLLIEEVNEIKSEIEKEGLIFIIDLNIPKHFSIEEKIETQKMINIGAFSSDCDSTEIELYMKAYKAMKLLESEGKLSPGKDHEIKFKH